MQFENTVVLVTGGGRGIGYAVAKGFLKNGASVFLNDVGCSVNGKGSDQGKLVNAAVERLKKECQSSKIVGDYHSIVDGNEIVQCALKAFGKIDVLVHNAAIIDDVTFHKMTHENWDNMYHHGILGSIRLIQAVWHVMRKQRYGKIVNMISAAALYGNFGQANYAAVKMAILGLNNVLKLEGIKYNISVNAVAPIAGTRMTREILPDELVNKLRPECTVPFIMQLCHESCNENGGIFEMGGRWIGKLRFERSRGLTIPKGEDATLETIRELWDDVVDFSQSSNPESTQDAFQPIMESIVSSSKPNPSMRKIRSAAMYNMFKVGIESNGEYLVKHIGGIMQWNIGKTQYTVDLSKMPATLLKVPAKNPDATITVAERDFTHLVTGKLKADQALLQGKVRVAGNMKYMLKLQPMISILRMKAKL